MAISVVGYASAGGAATTLTVTKANVNSSLGGTLTDGDLMIAVLNTDWGILPTSQSGWTAISGMIIDGGTNTYHTKLYYRVASSEGTDWTFDTTTGETPDATLSIIALRDATITGASGSIASHAVSGNTVTAPSIAADGGILLSGTSTEDGNVAGLTYTPPSGMTECADVQSTIWTASTVAYLLSPSNPTGTKVFTLSRTVTGTNSDDWSLVIPASSSGTNADAGNAAGTGTASDATVAVSQPAGNAAGTGAALAPTPNVGVAAGNAAGTGAAYDTTFTASSNPDAGNAAGTGAAYDTTFTASSNPDAGNAAGTGAAYDAAINTGPAAENAAGTGSAFGATADIAQPAENAAGTGTAYDAMATGGTVVDAENAAGTGAAYDATFTTSSSYDAGHAAGTGTAYDTATSADQPAGNAAGTGTAYDATASTSGSSSADAGNAAGTGTAYDAVTAVSAAAGHAAGTGAAQDATVDVGPAAGHAAGTGAAQDATTSVSLTAGHASGTGTAYDPTATGQAPGDATANAGLASGTGTAYDATATGATDIGSWWTLLSLVRDYRDGTYREPRMPSCPNDGEPYTTGPDGQLFCRFDGYRPDGPRTSKVPATVGAGAYSALASILEERRGPQREQLSDDPTGRWG